MNWCQTVLGVYFCYYQCCIVETLPRMVVISSFTCLECPVIFTLSPFSPITSVNNTLCLTSSIKRNVRSVDKWRERWRILFNVSISVIENVRNGTKIDYGITDVIFTSIYMYLTDICPSLVVTTLYCTSHVLMD